MIANLTPHSINVKTVNGDIIEIQPYGYVLRTQEKIETNGTITIDGIEVVRGKKSILPIADEDLRKVEEILKVNDYVIVSLLSAKALADAVKQGRTNIDLNRVLYIVNIVRGEDGKPKYADIIGVATDFLE